MSETALGFAPVLTDPVHRWLAIASAYVVLLATSGLVVRWTVGPTGRIEVPDDERRRETGRIIGKSENMLTLTFVLLGQETGLALIIAAKSIVRGEEVRRDPRTTSAGRS